MDYKQLVTFTACVRHVYHIYLFVNKKNCTVYVVCFTVIVYNGVLLFIRVMFLKI